MKSPRKQQQTSIYLPKSNIAGVSESDEALKKQLEGLKNQEI
jgi:hypothetical protein